jgi:hypothetical protein
MGFNIWIQGIEKSSGDYVRSLVSTTLDAMVAEVFVVHRNIRQAHDQGEPSAVQENL